METNKDVGTVQPSASLAVPPHTSGPWALDKSGWAPWPEAVGVVGPDNEPIAWATQFAGDAAANAAMIVSAVNSHADMLAALKMAEEWLSTWASADPYIGYIRAAIAKAEGRAPLSKSPAGAVLITSPTGDR
jgi:hypothetical protein